MAEFWARLLYLRKWISCEEHPIIGIMTQEFPSQEKDPEFSSYINIAYVKAVESSGARVVPIFINRTEQYYRDTLQKINGVVVPGGSADFLEEGGIGPSTKIVISIAKELNNNRKHFPVLGVCWGFELFLYLTSQGKDIMQQCDCEHMSLSLEKPQVSRGFFASLFSTHSSSKSRSRFLHHLSFEEKKSLWSAALYNNHKWCMTEKNFSEYKLDKKWRILTTSTKLGKKSKNGKKFVSMIESKKYPFLGVQFHPESSFFTWRGPEVEHNESAIKAARLFYDWLIWEARGNRNCYPSPELELKSLIWNYPLHSVNSKLSASPEYLRFVFHSDS